MAKILIVDDEQHIRDFYSIELEDEGYNVHTTASGNDILAKVDNIQPDAVILDIKLGDCDGLEVLEVLRELHHDLPIILCSAYDSYNHDRRAIAADYYIVKSFDLCELKVKLERAIQACIAVLTENDEQRH